MPKRRFKTPTCPNCGTRFVQGGHFCPGCGQESHDLDVPVKDLVAEALEGFLHFDGKSLRTVRALVLCPGLLTLDWIEGRRARYVAPVRLYVFVSFLFFLLLALLGGRQHAGERRGQQEEIRTANLSLVYKNVKAGELQALSDAEVETLMRDRGLDASPLDRHVIRQLARVSRGGQLELRHLFVSSLSKMMFALMPVFGLLLYLCFRKTHSHYVASLVFSLHYHSVGFVLLAVAVLLSRIHGLGGVLLAAPLGLAVHLPIALRRVYRRSWAGSVACALLISLLHLALVIVLFVVTVFAGILLF